jgi:hypothetical protein
MQHALDLIWQKREAQEIEARAPSFDIGQKDCAAFDPRPFTLDPIQPQTEMARYTDQPPDLRWSRSPCFDKRLDLLWLGIDHSAAAKIRLEPSPGRFRSPFTRGACDGQFWNLSTIQEYFDAPASLARCLAKRLRTSAMKRRNHPLDVFAGSQAVDAVIDAPAGIGGIDEAAQLHFVGTAGSRPRAKRTEHGVVAFDRLNFDDFGASPPPADCYFVRVRRQPALRRRGSIEHRPSLGVAGTLARPRHPRKAAAACGLCH